MDMPGVSLNDEGLARSSAGDERFALTGYNRVPRPMKIEPAAKRLRILFIYSRPPLPMTRGDELTVSHLIEFLSRRGHEIDFLTLEPAGFKWRDEHKSWIAQKCRRFESFQLGRISSLINAGIGVLKGLPVQIGLMGHSAQKARAVEWAKSENYDLAYAYYIRSSDVLHAVKDDVGTTFLALQLSQTLNTQRLSQTARTFIERLFYRFESYRLSIYESRIWQGIDHCVLIGPKDLEAIKTVCRDQNQPEITNHVYGPHGVDTDQFAPVDPAQTEAQTVVMSGVMRYAPNVEAANWFAREVWPLILKERPQAQFYIVGRDPLPAVQALGDIKGVTVTGTVDEPAEWIAKATVSVAPIRAAAGLQNKLLEAMAMAKPVVATTVANEGIGAEPERDLLLADTPEQMANAILALMNDPDRRHELGCNARAYIEDMWTWAGPFLQLEKEFMASLDRKNQ